MGYINEKRAYIEKTPEPFKVISKNHTTGVFTGRFIKYKNAQPDFKGTIFGGYVKNSGIDNISLKKI